MTAIDYIKNKLNQLSESIKNIRLIYGYDRLSSIHVIEVSPKFIYDDSDYIHKEKEIIDEFMNLYPKESIAFIAEGDVPGIENESYRVIGNEYSGIVSCDFLADGKPLTIKDEFPISFPRKNTEVMSEQILRKPMNAFVKESLQIEVNSVYTIDYSLDYSPLAA